MGLINRWIRARCQENPDGMVQVARRPWGNLAAVIDEDGRCGCLVGTAELVGVIRMNRMSELEFYLTEQVGNRVFDLCLWPCGVVIKRPQVWVIALLKRAIWRHLRDLYPERFVDGDVVFRVEAATVEGVKLHQEADGCNA